MLKAKIKPTFNAKVKVHVHGGETHEIDVEFKHMRKDDFQAYFARAVEEETPQIDQLLGLVESWRGLEFEPTRDGMAELDQLYPSVIPQILMAYAEELAKGRRGN